MLYRFTVPGELVKLYIQGFFIYFKLLKKKVIIWINTHPQLEYYRVISLKKEKNNLLDLKN